MRLNNLPCSSVDSHELVCDACLHGKAHQLPYPTSSSHSSFSLLLIHLAIKSTMCLLLMILVNLLGSISFFFKEF
jgi:hypothetical protein